MQRKSIFLSILGLGILACGVDVGLTETSKCDGALQGNEDSVDSPYDEDGDGYFDAANADCAAVYTADRLDCDDLNADVNPGMTESTCDGLDNDCDPETIDGEDLDQDGFTACADQDCDDTNPDIYPGNAETPCNGFDDDCNPVTIDDADDDNDGWSICDQDCNDDNEMVNPGLDEVCEDEIDNNCDGDIDEACEEDWNGTWFLDDGIYYDCAMGYVEIAFSTVEIVHSNANLQIEGEGTKGQPGKTSGKMTGWSFETERKVTGGCTETYLFQGEFLTMDTFEGSFIARYTGGASNCLDCKTQKWDIVGTR